MSAFIRPCLGFGIVLIFSAISYGQTVNGEPAAAHPAPQRTTLQMINGGMSEVPVVIQEAGPDLSNVNVAAPGVGRATPAPRAAARKNSEPQSTDIPAGVVKSNRSPAPVVGPQSTDLPVGKEVDAGAPFVRGEPQSTDGKLPAAPKKP